MYCIVTCLLRFRCLISFLFSSVSAWISDSSWPSPIRLLYVIIFPSSVYLYCIKPVHSSEVASELFLEIVYKLYPSSIVVVCIKLYFTPLYSTVSTSFPLYSYSAFIWIFSDVKTFFTLCSIDFGKLPATYVKLVGSIIFPEESLTVPTLLTVVELSRL